MAQRLAVLALLVAICLGGTYNESLSRLTASYSAISHCKDDTVTGWTCAECKKVDRLTDVIIINNHETDIHGYVGYHKGLNRVVVAWRGTIDARNWIEDFGYKKIPYIRCKSCEVHAGFFAAWESVANQTEKHVGELLTKYSTAQITVTGQSLGGALSTFCAIELQLKFGKVGELYNFGAPRIGNDHTAAFINSKLPSRFRVIHNRDIVPHVPFEEMGFKQIAFEVLYDEAMKTYKVCNDSGEDNTCSNRFDPEYSFPDHDVYWIAMDDSVC